MQALAIFFGSTPASMDGKPRAAVPVIYMGRIIGDTRVLRDVESGAVITLKTCD